MTDRSPTDRERSSDFYNDPDRQNAEQNEEGSQAQDVAADALAHEAGDLTEPDASLPEDSPDLVDLEKAMLRSGRIDMGAFEGEPDMDDEAE